jgi:hypothetical protein
MVASQLWKQNDKKHRSFHPAKAAVAVFEFEAREEPNV